MDELYAFLFAGLIILLMLFVFFGGATYTPTTINQPNATKINKTPKGNLTWKTMELGDIEILQKELEKKEIISKKFEVHNGIFFGKDFYKAKYDVEKSILNTLNNASLSYSIEDTNNYGELETKFNNITLYEGSPAIGEYNFNINPKEKNEIEITTTSSGWKIWAPSEYIISNLSIDMNYKLKKYPKYEFFVSDYIHNNLRKGQLVFKAEETNAKLNITLNNQTVYEQVPHSGTNIFELINLKEGRNEIKFFSEENLKLEDVRIRLYYYK